MKISNKTDKKLKVNLLSGSPSGNDPDVTVKVINPEEVVDAEEFPVDLLEIEELKEKEVEESTKEEPMEEKI